MSYSIGIQIRKAALQDAHSIAEILGKAFQEDPVMPHILPHCDFYSIYFEEIFSKQYCQQKESYITEDISGAALWLPPGVKPKNPSFVFGVRWIKGMVKYKGFKGIKDAIQLIKKLNNKKPRENHYYLHAIGVRSESRGKGIGCRLMLRILEKCDKEKQISYLENSNGRNLPLYERHGFKVQEEYLVTPNGPKIWFMIRKPNLA